MVHYFLATLETITAVGAVAGIAYYLLCLWSAQRFLADQASASSQSDFTPPVSILKPLKGVDPSIYESFRSHCLQNYPNYEIIFGVGDASDAAVEVVEQLRKEFPQRQIQLVVCPRSLGTNLKVSNLGQMLPRAQHNFLIVNDSDIRVPPDYLQRVMAPLQSPSIGMVTCLYRGVPAPTLGSRLESLGISTDFAAGVLVARSLEGVKFGLGSTLAFRKDDLVRVGGFDALLDYLADDYQLGRRIAQLGLQVQLSAVVVETFLPAYDFKNFFEHQLRWARSVRDSRRWGYVGMLFTFGLAWAVLAAVVSRGATWSWELLGAAIILRLFVAWVVGSRVLHDRFLVSLFALLPLRDLIAVLVWCASFASDTIAWRGTYFHLRNGKLSPADSPN